MALVGDIQLQDNAVKPPALDTSKRFSAEGLTATTAFAVTDAGAGNTVSTTGLITAKSSNDISGWLQTTKSNGNVSLYLSNDARPDWALKVSGTSNDEFVIGNSTGANDTCQYPALSIGTAGAVGIGKYAPSNSLDITYRNSSSGGVVITEATNSVATKIISLATCSVMGTSTNHKLGFITNNTTVGMFDTSGNLGIGTEAPGATLDVRGSAIFNEAGAAVDFRVEGDTEANLFLVDGSTDRIGIGTATPAVTVDIDTGGDGSDLLLCVNGCVCAAGYIGEKQGHVMESSEVAFAQRAALNFVVTDVGCLVDDASNDATVVCINGANTCVPFTDCDGASDPISLVGGSIGNALSNDSNPTLGGLMCGGGNNICAVCCICITGCYFGDGSQLTGVSSVPSSFSADCTIIGCDAGGNVAAGGAKITLIGGNAGYTATTPCNVVALGTYAAQLMTTATDTVLIGTFAGRCVLTCAGNLALGAWTLYNECAGSFNTALGTCAGLTQKGASDNTFVGAFAGTAITTGGNNVFLGMKAGCAETSGSHCLIIANSCNSLITGCFSIPSLHTVGCVIVGGTTGTGPLAVWSSTGANTVRLIGRDNGTTDEAELLFTHYDTTTAHGNITGQDTGLNFSGGTTLAMRINSTGSINIGGQTTADLNTGYANLQLGGNAVIQQNKAIGAGKDLQISQNAAYAADGSWEYISTDEASNYYQLNGEHVFRRAASGTAGNDISWSTRVKMGTDVCVVADNFIIRESDDGNNALTFTGGASSGAMELMASGSATVHIDGNSGVDTYFNAGDVGIGTTAPSHLLTVQGSSAVAIMARGENTTPSIIMERQDTSVTSGNSIGDLAWYGGEDSTENIVAEIAAHASQTWTDTASGTDIVFQTTPNNSVTPAEVMWIVDDGDVGIGTSSPDVFSWGTHTLTLYDAGATNSNPNIDIIATGTGTAAIIFGGGTTSGTDASIRRASIYSSDGSCLAFATNNGDSGDNGTERLTILGGGNIGIGTANPGHLLEVHGDSKDIRLSSNDYDIAILSYDGVDEGLMALKNAGANKVLFTANGDSYVAGGSLGIGTATPSKVLHILGDDNSNPVGQLIQQNGTDDATLQMHVVGGSGGGNYSMRVGGSGGDIGTCNWGIYDEDNSAVRLVIADGGEVGIGTTAPTAKAEIAFDSGGFDTTSVATMIASSSLAFEGNNDMRIIFEQDGSTFRGMMGYAHAGDTYIGIWDNGSSTTPSLVSQGGEIGIGTTVPSSTLDVRGAVSIQGTYDGNAMLLFEKTSGDGNQWEIYPHTTGLAFYNRDDSCYGLWLGDDQKVGINTAVPDGTFHVYSGSAGSVTADGSGDELVLENSNHVGMSFLSPNDKSAYIFFGDPDCDEVGMITYGHSSDALDFYVNDGFVMRIDSSQNVGIGTTVPAAELHVEKANAGTVSTGGNAQLIVENSSHSGIQFNTPINSSAYIYKGDPGATVRVMEFSQYGNDSALFYLQDTEVMRISGDCTGIIGLGTSNPGAWGGDAQRGPGGPNNGLLDFVIYNRDSDSAGISIISCTGDSQDTGYAGINFGDGATATSKCWNGTFAYFNYGAEFRLQQYCTGNNLHLMNFRTAGQATNGIFQSFMCNDPNSTDYYMLRFETTGGNRFYTYSNGNVVNTNNSYGAVSDCNEKCCIADARSYWDDYKNVQFRKFRWKCDNVNDPNVTNSMGVIAQEIEQIWPSIIDCTAIHAPHSHGDILCTAEGNACVRKAMKYSVLNVISGKVLQEAVNRIESLEACVIELGG